MVALEEGWWAHEQIIQSGLEQMFLCPIAWLTYAKCGSIENARRVFNKMPSQNVVTWNAILGGCAMHGCGKEALEHFEQMCEGVHPNDITFVFCHLLAMQVWWMKACAVMLQSSQTIDFCKIGTLHLYGSPSWLCWPSAGVREYGHGNAL
jgi:pentatricopeptide repeat protein